MFALSIGLGTSDWVALAIGLLGTVSAALQARNPNKLPKFAQWWLKKITPEAIMTAVATAESLDTPEKRRQAAVDYVKKVAKDKLSLTLPTSVANLLVEFIYQQYQRRAGK